MNFVTAVLHVCCYTFNNLCGLINCNIQIFIWLQVMLNIKQTTVEKIVYNESS